MTVAKIKPKMFSHFYSILFLVVWMCQLSASQVATTNHSSVAASKATNLTSLSSLLKQQIQTVVANKLPSLNLNVTRRLRSERKSRLGRHTLSVAVNQTQRNSTQLKAKNSNSTIHRSIGSEPQASFLRSLIIGRDEPMSGMQVVVPIKGGGSSSDGDNEESEGQDEESSSNNETQEGNEDEGDGDDKGSVGANEESSSLAASGSKNRLAKANGSKQATNEPIKSSKEANTQIQQLLPKLPDLFPSMLGRTSDGVLAESKENLTPTSFQPKAAASLQLSRNEMNGILQDQDAPEEYRERENFGDSVLIGEERRQPAASGEFLGGMAPMAGSFNGGDFNSPNQRSAYPLLDETESPNFHQSPMSGNIDELNRFGGGSNARQGGFDPTSSQFSQRFGESFNAHNTGPTGDDFRGFDSNGGGGGQARISQGFGMNSFNMHSGGLTQAGSEGFGGSSAGIFGSEMNSVGGNLEGYNGGDSNFQSDNERLYNSMHRSSGFGSNGNGFGRSGLSGENEWYGAGMNQQEAGFNSMGANAGSFGANPGFGQNSFSPRSSIINQNNQQNNFGNQNIPSISKGLQGQDFDGSSFNSIEQRSGGSQHHGQQQLGGADSDDFDEPTKLTFLSPNLPIGDELVGPNNPDALASNNVDKSSYSSQADSNAQYSSKNTQRQQQQQQQQQQPQQVYQQTRRPDDDDKYDSDDGSDSNDDDQSSSSFSSSRQNSKMISEQSRSGNNNDFRSTQLSSSSRNSQGPMIEFARIGSAGYLQPHSDKSYNGDDDVRRKDEHYRSKTNYGGTNNPTHAGKYFVE